MGMWLKKLQWERGVWVCAKKMIYLIFTFIYIYIFTNYIYVQNVKIVNYYLTRTAKWIRMASNV